MNFKGMNGRISLGSIKSYDLSKVGNNNAFNNMNYSDIEEIDYSKYVEVDATDINSDDITDTKAASVPWYKVAADYCATAVGSFTFGILEAVENVGDGLIMAGGALASGVVSIFDKELSEDIKEGTQNAIQYDWTEAGYTSAMEAMGVNEDIAFGVAHNVAGAVGTAAGYIALSMVPGGAAVAATAGALGAAGSAAEMSFNQGATFDEALTVSAVAGVAGAVTGGVTNKIGAAAKGATTLGQVGKYALSGAAVSMAEPLINSTTEYLVYGQDMVDQNGNKVHDTFGEYYLGSGGVLNTVIAGSVGGVSAGLQGLGGYKANQKGSNVVSFVDDVTIQANTDFNYQFDKQSTFLYIEQLKSNGYSDIQIVDLLADYSSVCADYANKRAFANVSYDYLLDVGYSPEDAANILSDAYNRQLVNRGMVQVYTDSYGIKYNFVNNFNSANQAYTLEMVVQQVSSLPADVRNTIAEINFYDTFNPMDYYWHSKYKSTGDDIFTSAATAGNGQINIWSNQYADDFVIAHEAGHCFDVGNRYSGSQEYLEAMMLDASLTGKASITDYGGNNVAEDFADSISAYKNGYVADGAGVFSLIDNFPNRKAFIEKHLKVENQQYLSIYDMKQLNQVAENLINSYGKDQTLWSFYNYLSTGDINNIPLPSSQKIVSNMDINGVMEYYNLLNGGNS